MTSIILSESGFGDHIGVRANQGDLKAKPSKGVKEGRNGEADCVDLCASLFHVCGRYGARSQKSRDMNDPSRGSRVLVSGIVIISTVGEAILLEGTASMHADGIYVGVSAISRRWDSVPSVCSEYFFSAEIGRYKKNYPVTLTLNPGWSP